MAVEELMSLEQYSLDAAAKEQLLLAELNALTLHHARTSPEYARLLSALHPRFAGAASLADVPYIPVGLFKSHRLVSVDDSAIFKTLTSSGTTGEAASQIYLDAHTAHLQSNALAAIMTATLGPERLPMIIVDSKSVLKDRKRFSARAAGVLGMMSFGARHFYALDENMDLDLEGLRGWLEANEGRPLLIFGFTFMVWEYFYKRLRDEGIDLSRATVVHSGGWKKLQQEAVSNAEFKALLAEATGIRRVYNFYGMVEQVGSVFVEGDDGYLFAPNFADVIVRDPVTWEEAPVGRPGVIQVLSALPHSYPGHSLLTEDLGVIHGIDDSVTGRRGKYFSVLGRVPRAELRGCSDTHAFSRGAA